VGVSAAAEPCACARCKACVAVAMYVAGAATKDIEARSGLYRRELYEQLRARGLAPAHRSRSDLSGRRFGDLTVLGLAGKDRHGQTRWRCACACGNERVVTRFRLTGGRWKVTACLACTERRIGRAAA